MKKMNKNIFRLFISVSMLLCAAEGIAQSHLQKLVTLDVKRQRADHVLELISNRGDFYFSYNSQLFRRDSLISFDVQQKSVQYVLDLIFDGKLTYVESGRYVILKPRPVSLVLESRTDEAEKFVHVKGWVLDDFTGERIGYASVYDRKFLASALTNDNGYFALRFKYKKTEAQLYVSKAMYKDTSVVIPLNRNQQLTIPLVPVVPEGQVITVSPQDYLRPDTVIVRIEIDPKSTKYLPLLYDTTRIEKNPFASFILSSRQKIQSLNLKNFFTTRPYQVSVVPGWSTQGKLSAQVVNNFSFNIFGGYTGGVNGAEIGGFFNINKKSVKYLQVGGLFNITGGSMRGLQVGGIHNMVMDSANGLQVGGITNMVKGSFKGMQVGGIWNHVNDSLKGVQIGGIGNFTRRKAEGVQVAGIINISADSIKGTQVGGIFNIARKTIRGSQISGIINYAQKVTGTQIGLINIADTSSGYSIGLINLVFNGYHKLAISSNEAMPLQISLKTGNRKFYSILMGGGDFKLNNKLYSLGYGFGSEIKIARWLSVNPELSAEYVYQGDWDYWNMLNKLNTGVHFHITKWLSVFGGPSVSAYYSRQPEAVKGYQILSYEKFSTNYKIARNLHGWIGWTAGIHLF